MNVLVTIQTVLEEMSSHKAWNIFDFEYIALSKRLFLVIVDKIATIIGISQQFPQIHDFFLYKWRVHIFCNYI